MFLIAGAWPVFGFFGLDVLLVYWAFRANYRAARAYETVTVTSSELTVRKVSHRGHTTELKFNPLWVRLEREPDPEFNAGNCTLCRATGNSPLPASCRRRKRTASPARLQAALHEARRGPTRTVTA